MVMHGSPQFSRAERPRRAGGAHSTASNHTPNRRAESVDIGGSPKGGSAPPVSPHEGDEVIYPKRAAAGLRIRAPIEEDGQGFGSVSV